MRSYGSVAVVDSPRFPKNGGGLVHVRSIRIFPPSHDEDSDDDSEALLSQEHLIQRAETFSLPYDSDRGYRATELKYLSFARPHMRAFHGSWICFFVSGFVQFAMAPILPELQKTLHLTKSDIWLSNIYSMIGGIPLRFLLGPLSDKHGARRMVTTMLALMAIPCALCGLITSLSGLLILRFAIGSLDNSVPCQYWITCHFVRETSGTAMALSSGLGAIGSAMVQPVVGSLLFPLCFYLTDNNSDLAWRLALLFPAVVSMVTAVFFFFNSEDCPLGNFTEVKRAGLMIERSAMDSFRSGALNLNSWILFLQFAGSCGVDLTMCNGAAIYYHERFSKRTETAGAVAGLYGVSAVFGRWLGGYMSDALGKRMSMRGRLWAQLISMLMQGLLTIVWAKIDTFGASVVVMVVFSTLVQTSIGTCYSILPYIDGPNTGSVAGIVGAGGNFGAMILATQFRNSDYAYSVEFMGWFTIALAFLTPLIVVKGYKGIVFGKDDPRRRQGARLLVPAVSQRSS